MLCVWLFVSVCLRFVFLDIVLPCRCLYVRVHFDMCASGWLLCVFLLSFRHERDRGPTYRYYFSFVFLGMSLGERAL